MAPEHWYNEQLTTAKSQLVRTNKHIRNVSMLRILLFIGTFMIIYFLWEKSTTVICLGASCTFIPFLGLLKLHTKLFYRKQWLEVKISLLQNELKGLQNDYSNFEDGKEFINPEHNYSYDLDIFGKRSLFQAVNRTCTLIGKQTLAQWMSEHLRKKEDIKKRQTCIQELSQHTDFRIKFAILGKINQTQTNDELDIRKWATQTSYFTKSVWANILVWGVPLTNLILLTAGLLNIISFSWFGIVFFTFVVFSFSVVKRATTLQEEYAQKLMILDTYAQLIAWSEKQNWKAPGLQGLINDLKMNGQSPAKILQELSKELSRLDLRNNQFLYVLLEGSIFFQLRQMVRIENWKQRYGNYLEGWIQAVGKIDALCSLATFAYNHPDYIYPNIADQPFCFKAKEMGHPLIPANQCITNDATIPSRPYFLIITGANMAGKSTYLRTIGINYLLSCIGAPVCCKELTLYPAQLVTSLRTTDSLSENESYFFAELKRIGRIIDKLNQGEELFIILDEILKGTNSADKQKGSFNLIRQFILNQTNGIIATHDLLLGELAQRFPENIKNYCFEADITNEELTFSYKLREGIAQNMNACFLMQKMGITFE